MPKSDNSDDCFSLQDGGWMELRRKIWDQLEEKKQLLSRRPPYKLIPNFKGSDAVVSQLMDLEFMKSATVVMCDPDRVLADVRLYVLQEGKTLVVPSPRLKSGILRRIVPAKDAAVSELKNCARTNSSTMGVTIDFDQKLHLDVVILSSIAANEKGRRIGRADLFAELELTLLSSLGSVDEQTVVVTAVHDLQLVGLDDASNGPHDVGADYIVTPTQVIKCERSDRPMQVQWSTLGREALAALPVLKFFRQQDGNDGKDTALAGETAAVAAAAAAAAAASSEITLTECLSENVQSPGKLRSFKGKNKRKKRNGHSRSEDQLTSRENSKEEAMETDTKGKSASESDAVGGPNKPWRRNNRRRTHKPALGISSSDDQLKENRGGEIDPTARRSEGRRLKFRRDQSVLPALYIGGLVRNLRTWELRRLVKDHDVRPLFIVRPPFVGYAFLHFKSMDEVKSALDSLSRLCLSDEGIRVEIARRSASLFGGQLGEDGAGLSQ